MIITENRIAVLRAMLPEFNELTTKVMLRLLLTGQREDLLLADEVHRAYEKLRKALL